MKHIFKITSLILFVFASEFTFAQNSEIYTAQTKLIIQSEDAKGKPFTAYTEFANMNLSLSTGDFLLRADLSVTRTGDRSLDSIISIRGPQGLSFKGKMNELYLFNQSVNDEKSYNLEGKLSINNISIPCVAQFDPVNFGEKTESKNYRLDFKLVIDPAKITILGLENKLNKQLVFEIMDGILNTQP